MRKFIALCGFVGVISTSAWAADAAAGKTVYSSKCAACHRADGSGTKLTKTPLGSAEVQAMSDADLKKVITEGKGNMKPVSRLKDADLDNLIAHIRTFKK